MNIRSIVIGGAAVAVAGGLFVGIGFATAAPGTTPVAAVTASSSSSPSPSVSPVAASTPTASTTGTPAPIAAPTQPAPPAPAQSAAPAPSAPTAPVVANPIVPPTPEPGTVPVTIVDHPIWTPANPQPINVPAGFTAALMDPSKPYDPITNPTPQYAWYIGCQTRTDTCTYDLYKQATGY